MRESNNTNGRERLEVALIGAGIGGSLSPALHEREGRLLGFDYHYGLLDLDVLGHPPERVGALVERTRRDGLRGLNVTYPCKQLVLPALDRLSPEAEALGAVNTVVFSGAGATGHNTDVSGFRESFAAGLPGAATERVVVLGAGGAGAAVAHALLSLGAAQVRLVDLDRERTEALASSLGAPFGRQRVSAHEPADLERCLADADGLVHATPTGMHDHGGTAVPADLLAPRLWVAEVVYFPLETELLRDARAAGCRTLDGGGMVAFQAADSLELFTGVAPDRTRMAEHMARLLAPQREEAECEPLSQRSL